MDIGIFGGVSGRSGLGGTIADVRAAADAGFASEFADNAEDRARTRAFLAGRI